VMVPCIVEDYCTVPSLVTSSGGNDPWGRVGGYGMTIKVRLYRDGQGPVLIAFSTGGRKKKRREKSKCIRCGPSACQV